MKTDTHEDAGHSVSPMDPAVLTEPATPADLVSPTNPDDPADTTDFTDPASPAGFGQTPQPSTDPAVATRLSRRKKFLLALPMPAMSLSSVLVHNVYIKIYTDILKLDPLYVGLLYLIFNIWNFVNDPIFGYLIDKKRYDPRKGKFLYLMRVSVPFILLCLVAMALSSPSWSQQLLFTVLLVELFIFDTAATVFGISSNCFLLVAAPTKEERVDVNVIQNYVANVVSFFATLIPTFLLVGDTVSDIRLVLANALRSLGVALPWLNQAADWLDNRLVIVIILMAIIALNAVLYAVAVLKLKDRPEYYRHGNDQTAIRFGTLRRDLSDILRMPAFRSWMLYSIFALAPAGIYFTAFLYFMDHVIRTGGLEATLVDTLPMLVVFALLPLLGRTVKRIGGKGSIYIGFLPYIIGHALLFFVQSWIGALIAYVPIMIGKYLVTTANAPLGAAIIDENEQQTGVRKTGLFSSISALLGAPVASVQLMLFMAIINYAGYVPGAASQSATAMLGIRIATAAVPIAFALLGLIPLFFFPYDRQREEELSRFSEEARRG